MIKDLITKALQKKDIQHLINKKEYHFQHLLNVKDKFHQFEISNNSTEKIRRSYQAYKKGTFESFVKDYSGEEREFLDLTGEFISYLDLHASGKTNWNKYDDNRTIAKAGVRQNHWVNHLLLSKIDINHSPSPSIRHAFNYAISPSSHPTILSIRHRRLISDNLLAKAYNPNTLTASLKSFFEPYKIKPANPLNLTYILSCIIYDLEIKKVWEESEQEEKKNPSMREKPKLNQIIYGPPGTGKTYKIIKEHLKEKPIEKVEDSKIYVDEKKNFWHLAPGRNAYLWEELKTQNHLGYEWNLKDLGNLKGLSPDTESYDIRKRFTKVQKGDYFCIISGKKFYAIAKALHDYDFEKATQSRFDFQTIEVEWIRKFEQPELLNAYSTMSFSNLKGSKRWKTVLEALENQIIYSDKKKGEEVKKAIKNYSLISFHQSFSYEDFIEGIKPNLENAEETEEEGAISYVLQDGIFKNACDRAARLAGYEDLMSCLDDTKEGRIKKFENAPTFSLLIDEINRGNISAIFGELITLIEDDKRLGKENELIIELPYSKKEFGVPGNLVVIGTMNTADRSVEALDTALRRRFSFEEKGPDLEVLSEYHPTEGIIDEIDVKELLSAINSRIEVLIDKDHKIGHAYFMKTSSFSGLKRVFKEKVIPLLEEYFYGDVGKIGLVLGKEFIIRAQKKISFAAFEHPDKDFLQEKEIYQFVGEEAWTPESFMSIYSAPRDA